MCWKNPVAQLTYSKYWYGCLWCYFMKLQNLRPVESFKPNGSHVLPRIKGLDLHTGVWEATCLSHRKLFRHCRNLAWQTPDWFHLRGKNTSCIYLFTFFKLFFFTERVCVWRERGAEGEREKELKQAPCSATQGLISRPWDHELRQNQEHAFNQTEPHRHPRGETYVYRLYY